MFVGWLLAGRKMRWRKMNDDNSNDRDLLIATMLCHYCEAPLAAGSENCRSCRMPTSYPVANPYEAHAVSVPKEINAGTNSASAMVSVLLTGVLLLLLAGIGFQNLGIAILLALLTIPPWIRTVLVMRRRSKAGLETSKVARVSMFVGSVFITWLILFIALVSCFLTFCFACIGALSVAKEDSAAISIAGVAAFSVFVVIVLAFVPLIRHRFRRDSQKK